MTTPVVRHPEDVSAYYILTREIAPRAVKLLHHLGRSIHRHGHRSFTRDLSEAEAISRLLREIHEPLDKVELAEIVHSSKHEQLAEIGIINPVLSCDLHWLIPQQPFTHITHTKRIYSLWFGDLDDFVHVSKYAPQKKTTVFEAANHERVRHLFFDPAMLETAKKIGFQNVSPIIPAAPEEYLERAIPTTTVEKLAYLSFEQPPRPALPAINILTRNGGTPMLRRLAIEEILQEFGADPIPNLDKNILLSLLDHQMREPATSAIDIILDTLPHPLPLSDMVRLVGHCRSVFRYDTPALIRHLFQAGIVEVFGHPEIWALYGVTAHPAPRIHSLVNYYQTFQAHLFTAQPHKGLTVTEHPFEAAACGRLPVVLAMKQVAGWIPQTYEATSQEPAALTEELKALLGKSSSLLRRGADARETVRSSHTWSHRLECFPMEGP